MKNFLEDLQLFFETEGLVRVLLQAIYCIFFSFIALATIFTVSLLMLKYGKWLYAFLGL